MTANISRPTPLVDELFAGITAGLSDEVDDIEAADDKDGYEDETDSTAATSSPTPVCHGRPMRNKNGVLVCDICKGWYDTGHHRPAALHLAAA